MISFSRLYRKIRRPLWKREIWWILLWLLIHIIAQKILNLMGLEMQLSYYIGAFFNVIGTIIYTSGHCYKLTNLSEEIILATPSILIFLILYRLNFTEGFVATIVLVIFGIVQSILRKHVFKNF